MKDRVIYRSSDSGRFKDRERDRQTENTSNLCGDRMKRQIKLNKTRLQ